MKHIFYLFTLSIICFSCKKDYDCTTVITRTDNGVELAREIKSYDNQSKTQLKTIEGVQYKTYLGMDATYYTSCDKQ